MSEIYSPGRGSFIGMQALALSLQTELALRGSVSKVERQNHIIKAAGYFENLKAGRLSPMAMAENMTTSDVSLGVDLAISAKVAEAYKTYEPDYVKWTVPVTLPDFKKTRIVDMIGATGRYSEQNERQDTEFGSFDLELAELEPKLFAKQYSYTLQMVMNDRTLGILDNLPNQIATGGRLTQEYIAEQAILAEGGIRTDIFTTARGNLISEPLSLEGVEAAVEAMSNQTDSMNDPIINVPKILLVPPQLRTQAQAIISALEIRTTVGDNQIIGSNPYSNLEIAVLPYTKSITGLASNLPWGLVADQTIGRPAVVFGNLAGFETPQLFRKLPDAVPLSGGSWNFDFEHNASFVKGMVAGNAAVYDYRAIVMSNGY